MAGYFSKEELLDTPSFRLGMDFKTESKKRKEGVSFIGEMGNKINLGYNTIATAVYYFHRFYMSHSFTEYPLYITACSCLFLAGKVEETPKRSKDLLKAAWELASFDEKVILKRFGETPRDSIMKFESVLLQTINFHFEIDHPYRHLVKYAKYLKGDKSKVEIVVQMAWNFVNDSLSTTLCLEWEPEIIAIAIMHISSKFCSFVISDWKGRRPKHTKWWDLFVEDLDNFILEDIGNQILDLYADRPAVDNASPSSIPTSDVQTTSCASSPDETTQTIDDTNEKMDCSSSSIYLPGFPQIDLSVPPPGMYSTPPPVHYLVPPPVNLSVPPPVNLSVPPPVTLLIPPPVTLSIPPPVTLPVLPPVTLPAPHPVTLPAPHPVTLPVPPPVTLPVPPPVTLPVPPPVTLPAPLPITLPVPHPVNLPVPPPGAIPIPPPAAIPIPPPVALPVLPSVNLPPPVMPVLSPINLSIPPPGSLSASSPTNSLAPPPATMPVLSPVNLTIPPPVNSPAPPPGQIQFPVNTSVPPPTNFSVPPPNYYANQTYRHNPSPPVLTPVQDVQEKINLSFDPTSELNFNSNLSYYTGT